jgi:hypothetical protein
MSDDLRISADSAYMSPLCLLKSLTLTRRGAGAHVRAQRPVLVMSYITAYIEELFSDGQHMIHVVCYLL